MPFTDDPNKPGYCAACKFAYSKHQFGTRLCPNEFAPEYPFFPDPPTAQATTHRANPSQAQKPKCPCSTFEQFVQAVNSALHFLKRHAPGAVQRDDQNRPTGTTAIRIEPVLIAGIITETDPAEMPDVYLAWSAKDKAAFRKWYADNFEGEQTGSLTVH